MKDNYDFKNLRRFGAVIKLSPDEMENKEIRTRYTYSNPIELEDEPNAHKVWLKVGVQSFCIGDVEDKEHADWMCDMLAKALGNMVRELRDKK